MMLMRDGIIYVATGPDYQEESCISAKSVKNELPNIPITVFSDEDFNCEYIDDVMVIDNPHYNSLDCIECLSKSPYDRTIYFDTDIYVENDISGIFNILGDYDMAAVHDTRHSIHHECPISNVPSDYPEYNTGVIGYQKNESTIEFFEHWAEVWKGQPDTMIDQPSFRASLYKSNLRVVTLPPEYNCLYSINPGYLNGPVKIFHGRLTDVDGYKGTSYTYSPQVVRSQLNSTFGPRAYTPYNGFKIMSRPSTVTEQFISSLQKNGIVRTAVLGGNKIIEKLAGILPNR